MRASLEWLRQYVALPAELTADEVADALIRIGHEIEGVHTPPPISGKVGAMCGRGSVSCWIVFRYGSRRRG